MTEKEEMTKETIDAAADIELINRFARIKLKPEEVYCFPLILCDNRTDRDGERFSEAALGTLSEMFLGKTGIFDHDPKGVNQTARIYFTEIRSDDADKDCEGKPYTCLFAKAYMMRTHKNEDLIKEIDGGIKKEVSVSCAVSSKICSICRRDVLKSRCAHKKGETYKGRLCVHILDKPQDAYEWSFVAVPAQKNAGVKKSAANAEQDSLFEEVCLLLHAHDRVLPLHTVKSLLRGTKREKLLILREELKKRLDNEPLVQIADRFGLKNENKSYRL